MGTKLTYSLSSIPFGLYSDGLEFQTKCFRDIKNSDNYVDVSDSGFKPLVGAWCSQCLTKALWISEGSAAGTDCSGVSRGVLRVLQHPPEAQRPIY